MNAIKLQTLRLFVAVYDERSISAAARTVHATQSGISVQIRSLEEQLGLVLFERVAAGVVPTKAGEQIYHRAVRILEEVGRLEEDVAAHAGQLSGEVRVGIMPTFARAILGPVLERFSDANPFVEVMATEGYSALLTQMVLAGDLDLAVVPGGDIPGGVKCTFMETDMELLASRRALDGVRGAVDLSRIPPLRLAVPGPDNTRRASIDQRLKNLSNVAHSVLELDSMMTTLDLVRRGGWCSILPGCLCLPDLDDPGMHFYPIDRPRMTVNYLLIEPMAKPATAAIRQFTEALTNEIRQSCKRCRLHFDGVVEQSMVEMVDQNRQK